MLNKKLMWVVDKFGKKRLLSLGFIIACLFLLLFVTLIFKKSDDKNGKDSTNNDTNRTSNQISLDDEVNQIKKEISNSSDDQQKLDYRYYLYDRYVQMQDYDKALIELKNIESTERSKFYVYEMYGDVYGYKKEKDEAIKYYDLAVKEASNDKDLDITIYKQRIEAKKSALDNDNQAIESGDAPG